jgi:thiaminase II
MPSFTEIAWDQTAGWRDAVERMPFIRALADGTLPADAFGFYLAQDAAYLVEFARALAIASQLAPDRPAQSFFADSAHVAIEVESDLHRTWLSAHPAPLGAAEPSPVTSGYTNHLLATCVSGSFPLVAAAVLPCYWLYAHIGEVLLRRAGDLTGHPYQAWISTYADPAFQEATRTARDIADRAAEAADDGTRERMFAAFERSSMHEYLFFEQGLTRPAWPRPADR